jgi:hypothetical protein
VKIETLADALKAQRRETAMRIATVFAAIQDAQAPDVQVVFSVTDAEFRTWAGAGPSAGALPQTDETFAQTRVPLARFRELVPEAAAGQTYLRFDQDYVRIEDSRRR